MAALGAAGCAEAVPSPRALPGQRCTRGSAALGNTRCPRCSRGCCRCTEAKPGVPRLVQHPNLSPRGVGECEQADGASPRSIRQCWDAVHFSHLHLSPCQGRLLPPTAGFGMRNPSWWHMGDIPVPAASRHCPLLHWGFGAAGAGFSSACRVLRGDTSVNPKSLSQGARTEGSCRIRVSGGTAASPHGPGLPRGTDSKNIPTSSSPALLSPCSLAPDFTSLCLRSGE